MLRNINPVERIPALGKLYYKIINSNNLKDILDKYEPVPKFSEDKYCDIITNQFNFLNDVDEDFFNIIDQSISEIKSNKNYLSNHSKEELKELIIEITKYINYVIQFFEVCCDFTNKNRSSELIGEVASRLYSVLPKELKGMIKISSYNRNDDMQKYSVDKIKNLIIEANKADMEGDVILANKIDAEISRLYKYSNSPKMQHVFDWTNYPELSDYEKNLKKQVRQEKRKINKQYRSEGEPTLDSDEEVRLMYEIIKDHSKDPSSEWHQDAQRAREVMLNFGEQETRFLAANPDKKSEPTELEFGKGERTPVAGDFNQKIKQSYIDEFGVEVSSYLDDVISDVYDADPWGSKGISNNEEQTRKLVIGFIMDDAKRGNKTAKHIIGTMQVRYPTLKYISKHDYTEGLVETTDTFFSDSNPNEEESDARKNAMLQILSKNNKNIGNLIDFRNVYHRTGNRYLINDPYKYIYDESKDNFVVVWAPKEKESLMGARMGSSHSGYEIIQSRLAEYNITDKSKWSEGFPKQNPESIEWND